MAKMVNHGRILWESFFNWCRPFNQSCCNASWERNATLANIQIWKLDQYLLFSVLSCFSTKRIFSPFISDLKWSPISYRPLKTWAPISLVPDKFGPFMKIIIHHFHAGTIFWGDQIYWGPNFSGPKFLGDQKSQGSKWDPGIISVIADSMTTL